MKRYIHSSLIVFVTLLLSISAFAADQKSSTETYLDELRAQGKERVIVFFKAEQDPSLIEKYGGKVIKAIPLIKSIVCEIPQENMQLIAEESTVEKITIDAPVKARPGCIVRDASEEKMMLKFKKEYLRKIDKERSEAIRMATQRYLKDMYEYLAKQKQIMNLYNDTLRRLLKANKKDRTTYLNQLAKYNAMLKECEKLRTAAVKRYKESIQLASDAYKIAAKLWLVKANEAMAASYTESLVRWENLPEGLNAKAAWDRYGLDGAGVKIAFLDTGINYGADPAWPMPNLAGNYLGGYDFVDDDANPMPFIHPTDWTLTESHGTMIASNCLGAGISKVIGAAYNAKYYSLRVLEGPDATGWTSDAVLAIEWCLNPAYPERKPDIINMSFGAYQEGSDKTALEAACNIAYNAGIILVAASGNDGVPYSIWPASFTNVISVGGHAEDQTLLDAWAGTPQVHVVSNGGVDFVSPGEKIYSVSPENLAFWTYGTSCSAAMASGMIALVIQYARDNDIQPNHGYLWELLKHSAKDMPLITDPVYKGSGKVWAADTAPTPPDVGDGSIDCMVAKWPLSYDFTYDNWVYYDANGYPAYYIGTNMYYDLVLTNNTGTAGTDPDDIENLDVTTTQAYYQEYDEVTLPGDAVELCYDNFIVPPYMAPADELPIEDSYFLPWEMNPGLNRIILDLQFEFASDTNNRLIKVVYPYSSIWCPPPLINQGFPITVTPR